MISNGEKRKYETEKWLKKEQNLQDYWDESWLNLKSSLCLSINLRSQNLERENGLIRRFLSLFVPLFSLFSFSGGWQLSGGIAFVRKKFITS